MDAGYIQDRFHINPESPTPFYVQLADFLRKQILSGDLPPGERLLSEEEFCNLLGISRTTVRQTIRLLEEDGLLMRFRGRGTFIKKPSIRHSYNKIYNFTQNMTEQGLSPSSRVLTRSVVRAGDTDVMGPLGLRDPEEMVFLFRRVRCVNGVPVIIDDTALPWALCEGIEQMDFETLSLYDVLSNRYHLKLSHARDILEAVTIGPEDSRILECLERTPAFHNRRTAWLDNGRPYEYTRSIMRADYCIFQFELSNSPNSAHRASIAMKGHVKHRGVGGAARQTKEDEP